jgi:hypothetical protein
MYITNTTVIIVGIHTIIFHFWRADRNQYGGGLVAYARSDLACDRNMNLEYQTIESICIEININNRKWLIRFLSS